MIIRKRYEEYVSKLFIKLYNIETNQNVLIVREGNPLNKEPDYICSNDIALEITSSYDNDYFAEEQWATARNKSVKRPKDILLFSNENFTNAIFKKIQKLNNGNYDGFKGKILLVCNLPGRLVGDTDIECIINEYQSFKEFSDKCFDEIWLSCLPNCIKRLE